MVREGQRVHGVNSVGCGVGGALSGCHVLGGSLLRVGPHRHTHMHAGEGSERETARDKPPSVAWIWDKGPLWYGGVTAIRLGGQWLLFTGIFVVITTFLICLGSGMVKKKVVW